MKLKTFAKGVLAAATLLLAACSGHNGSTELLEKVPHDMDIVVYGDLETIIESAGGTVSDNHFTLPTYFTDELNERSLHRVEKLNAMLSECGIDPKVGVVAGKFDYKQPVVLFSISSAKKLSSALENNGWEETESSSDFTIYKKKTYESSMPEYDDYSYIGVNDNVIYVIADVWVGSSFNAVSTMQDFASAAKSKNFASTSFAEYISDSNAGGLCVHLPAEMRKELRREGIPSSLTSLLNGVVCVKGSINGDNAEAWCKMFDEDGNEVDYSQFADIYDINATISSKALKFINKNEQLVAAMALKDVDWDELIEMAGQMGGLSRSQRAMFNVAQGYLNKLDGTMAVGVGLLNGMESIEALDRYNSRPFDEVMATIVVETKSGKGKSLLSDIKGAFDSMHIPYNETSHGIKVSVQDGIDFYVENHDDILVLSTRKIETGSNQAADYAKLTDYLMGAGVAVDHSDPLFRDLGIPYDVRLAMCGKGGEHPEGIIRMTVSGGSEKGIIAKIAKTAIKLKN